MGSKADMLISLSVKNLAVVEDLALQFQSGMTSLTGETGAGKSMLVDALSLVLGDRADSNMVRQGCERAEIEANFETTNNPALTDWLKAQELDDDAQCHLRRTISSDGRSRGYINGRQVALNQLKAVSECCIDIHGQHAHQSLLRPDTQRQLIDTVAGNRELLAKLKSAFKQMQECASTLEKLKQDNEQQQARLELLSYQVKELEIFSLTEQSVNQLLQDQQQLAHSADLLHAAEAAIHRIFDNEEIAAYDILSSALVELEKLQDIEPHFASIIETLNAALINLDESGSELRHYIDKTELDPERLEEVEQQISQLHDLARKHHCEIADLPAVYDSLHNELNTISHAGQTLTKLEQQLTQHQKQCLDLAMQIRERRLKAAAPLAEQITASIRELAMPAGRIEIEVIPTSHETMTETGCDQVRLLVTTNPGQAAGELGKIASGGELARISLAIQVVTAGQRSVPTLIFDEVDVGIGGGVAEVVGRHLRTLAASQQVICITHLAQVAAQAHQQLQVSKHHRDNSTHIQIQALDRQQRIEEIARMLGGMQLTEKTRLHAEEMLGLVELS